MKKIKEYYKQEIERVSKAINENKGDFRFAMVADSHLDNSLSDTFLNIKSVDEKVDFDCLTHLGDFLNGNIPREHTKKLLAGQMTDFRAAINGKPFYPVQGNHDGFSEPGISNDMTLDEDWFLATEFLNEYENLCRPGNKPYFYVDYPEKKIRLVGICSFHYTNYVEHKTFEKQYGVTQEQIDWLKNEAFKLDSDWSLMIFSHDVPFSNTNEDTLFKNNSRTNGDKLFNALLDAKKMYGFDVPAWFVGHEHGELYKNIFGINFVLIGCSTAYVPSLWNMFGGGEFIERNLGTVTEDLWDAVVLDKSERKLRLIRFGAGEDREIRY